MVVINTISSTFSPSLSVLVLRSLSTSAGDSALLQHVFDFCQALCGPPHVTVVLLTKDPETAAHRRLPEVAGK